MRVQLPKKTQIEIWLSGWLGARMDEKLFLDHPVKYEWHMLHYYLQLNVKAMLGIEQSCLSFKKTEELNFYKTERR